MKKLSFLLSAIIVITAMSFSSNLNAQSQERLKQALKKYPEADTNKDGKLSMEEARAFRSKMKGKKGERGKKPAAEGEVDDGKKYPQPADFKDGARCLFMGHSFFIPVAKQFDAFANAAGFSAHRASFVMKGGRGGAPASLWASEPHRSAAIKFLETGNVHLLGMTYHDEESCKVEDYKRFIDIAVKNNPKVKIYIGLCWPDYPSEKEAKAYDAHLGKLQAPLAVTIAKLRKAYPNNEILFVNYGRVAVELRHQLDAGTLSGVDTLTARSPNALYRDQKGHGGQLIVEMAALTWLEHLYGATAEKIKSHSVKPDALALLPKVAEYNKQLK